MFLSTQTEGEKGNKVSTATALTSHVRAAHLILLIKKRRVPSGTSTSLDPCPTPHLKSWAAAMSGRRAADRGRGSECAPGMPWLRPPAVRTAGHAGGKERHVCRSLRYSFIGCARRRFASSAGSPPPRSSSPSSTASPGRSSPGAPPRVAIRTWVAPTTGIRTWDTAGSRGGGGGAQLEA